MDSDEEDDLHIPVRRMFTLLDGVVAIAMTVLVLEIRIPPGLSGPRLHDALANIGHQILYFMLSVAVIGAFWRGHHHILKEARYVDAVLLWLNFAFLALLALIPLPTGALENYSLDTVGPAMYGLTIGLTALVELLMWLYITGRAGLTVRPIAPSRRRSNIINLLAIMAVFFGSVAVSLVNPVLALYMWLLLIPVRVLIGRFSPSRQDSAHS
jgi:uncharacterized membrane protein